MATLAGDSAGASLAGDQAPRMPQEWPLALGGCLGAPKPSKLTSDSLWGGWQGISRIRLGKARGTPRIRARLKQTRRTAPYRAHHI
jgi:hypothetical protein